MLKNLKRSLKYQKYAEMQREKGNFHDQHLEHCRNKYKIYFFVTILSLDRENSTFLIVFHHIFDIFEVISDFWAFWYSCSQYKLKQKFEKYQESFKIHPEKPSDLWATFNRFRSGGLVYKGTKYWVVFI